MAQDDRRPMTGRIVLVTSAAGGIGKATALGVATRPARADDDSRGLTLCQPAGVVTRCLGARSSHQTRPRSSTREERTRPTSP
jgi:NAD(P)-dependent dehydrogenase (short-subunit alcohol dehydrogenase family)